MIVNLFSVPEVDHSQVGGKAYNLHKLYSAGLPVPNAVVVRPHTVGTYDIAATLSELDWITDKGLFAIRSSGIGEDSQDKSWAGVFDSYLYVKPHDIVPHIHKVVGSLNSDRYFKYSSQSGIEIGGMAVIIQEMVDADYAGVSFTTSPVENDHRVALIEIVKGVGESLVSNQKTPATLRINKTTEMMRIQQIGDDELSEDVLLRISAKILPYMHKIEQLYGQSMDVEWAIRDDQVYILQARPITTI